MAPAGFVSGSPCDAAISWQATKSIRPRSCDCVTKTMIHFQVNDRAIVSPSHRQLKTQAQQRHVTRRSASDSSTSRRLRPLDCQCSTSRCRMFLINKKLYSHAVRDLGYTGECVHVCAFVLEFVWLNSDVDHGDIWEFVSIDKVLVIIHVNKTNKANDY